MSQIRVDVNAAADYGTRFSAPPNASKAILPPPPLAPRTRRSRSTPASKAAIPAGGSSAVEEPDLANDGCRVS